jgi:hypothetical protein
MGNFFSRDVPIEKDEYESFHNVLFVGVDLYKCMKIILEMFREKGISLTGKFLELDQFRLYYFTNINIKDDVIFAESRMSFFHWDKKAIIYAVDQNQYTEFDAKFFNAICRNLKLQGRPILVLICTEDTNFASVVKKDFELEEESKTRNILTIDIVEGRRTSLEYGFKWLLEQLSN